MSEASGPELRILLLEDVATDAELVQRALRKGGLRFAARVVDNRKAFCAALAEFRPEVVLSDYNLPDINGLDALTLARAHDPDLPVIEVTGALSDEAATELVRAGAKDYVLKDRLARLPFAVQRVLIEAREARARRAAEDALKLSEAKFRSIIEMSRDWIWETDAEGRFTYCSPRATELTGFSMSEFVGRTPLDFATEAAGPGMQRSFAEMTGAPRAFDLIETTFRAKDGREIVFEASGRPFYSDDGTLLGWRGDSRDITARKTAEREREQYLRFFRLTTDGMAIADPFGCFREVNPAFLALTGYSEAELIARPFMEFIHPDDRERTAREMELQVSTRPSMNFENRYLRKDGSVVELSWTAYFDKEEGVTYAAARDVTERNRNARELARQAAILAAVHETSPDGVLVVGERGEIVARNRRFAEVFKIPAEAFASGQDAPVLARAIAAAADPEQFRKRVEEYYAHPEMQGREQVRLADGRVLDRFGRTMRLADGTYIGRVWFFRDVTDEIAAEAAIRASEERFRGFVETSADLIWELDLDFRYSYVSPRIREWLGYAPEEIVGRSVFDFMSAEEAKILRPLMTAMKARPAPIEHVESSWVSKDGSRRLLVESSGVPVIGPDGALMGYRGADHDITERKAAEQRIRDEEARFRGLVEQDVAGIFIVSADGCLTYANPAAARMLGFSAEERIGDPFLTFLVPEERERVADRAAKRLAGEAVPSQYETVLQRKDGGRVEVLVHVALADFNGQLATVGVMLDITEQKKAQAKIRENEARFRALAEQDIAGIFILAADGKIGFVSPGFATVLGYAPDQVTGKPFADFITADSLQANVRAFGDLISGRTASARVEGGLKRADGGRMAVLTHAAIASIDGQPVVIGVIVDITPQKEAERNLRRLNRTLQTLSAGNEAMVRAKSEAELLGEMCRILVERGGFRMAWIGAPQNDKARTVLPVAAFGAETDYLKSVRISWSKTRVRGRGITGEAIRTGQPQTSRNVAADKRMSPWQAEAAKRGFASSAALPLKHEDQVFGVLSIYSAETDAFNEDALKLLRDLATDLAFGIRALRTNAEREAAVQHWRTGLVEMISAIAGTMEMRDPYTAGHQHRVSQIAVAIAQELKLPEDRVQGINLAGIIHDIGKITVPSELLTKPGKLSPLEFQLIQTHAQSGYEVVKGVDFPWPIADAIRQHHERLDGTGYPQGLKGDEIIEEAKILAVADVVEAMMSHRPYRPALGIDVALAEIEKNKGKLYDPAAVDACLKLFREKGFKLG